MNLRNIGLQIKHLRLTAGLTQKQLADKIGVTWEMVSRYETGRSSPMNRLLPLSEALKISPSQIISSPAVEDQPMLYQRNTIPLLDKPFTSLSTALGTTKNFYVAPDWIIQQITRPFAVDSSIVTFETSKISGNSILYISPEKPDSSSKLALLLGEKSLRAAPSGNKTSKQKILGTIIAIEKRL